MGKKGQNSEPSMNAFMRMNYLYQAGQLMSTMSSNSLLACYYGKLMKDISKKVVEKVHPELKRSLCLACSYPLLANCDELKAKVLSSKRKRKHQRKKKESNIKFSKHEKSGVKYLKSRIEARNKHPNKVSWSCATCGYVRNILQRPETGLWINNTEAVIS